MPGTGTWRRERDRSVRVVARLPRVHRRTLAVCYVQQIPLPLTAASTLYPLDSALLGENQCRNSPRRRIGLPPRPVLAHPRKPPQSKDCAERAERSQKSSRCKAQQWNPLAGPALGAPQESRTGKGERKVTRMVEYRPRSRSCTTVRRFPSSSRAAGILEVCLLRAR